MESLAQWQEEILSLEVFDTHTHLVGDRLGARDFWEIAHYFWLNREMQAAGYPANAAELPERERIAAFLEAHRASRNTLMNWVLTHIFRELYGIELKDEASVREADAAVRASAARPGWAQEVADRMSVRAFVTNISEHARFHGMNRDAVLIPRIDGKLHEWTKSVHEAEHPEQAYEEVKDVLHTLLDGYKEQGCPGIMTTLPGYAANARDNAGVRKGGTRDEALMALLHAVCGAVEQRGMLLQLFLGVERSWCGTAVPVNDPLRIVKLSALFERYTCPFELVVASDINNLDVVQAAWNFPNVHVGGMWWFNFRASTYRDVMQQRMEALPGMKSSLVVSDARCIEWSYGKIALVKRLIGEFLHEQIGRGWLDRETALELAKQWLYESAARRYGFDKGAKS